MTPTGGTDEPKGGLLRRPHHTCLQYADNDQQTGQIGLYFRFIVNRTIPRSVLFCPKYDVVRTISSITTHHPPSLLLPASHILSFTDKPSPSSRFCDDVSQVVQDLHIVEQVPEGNLPIYRPPSFFPTVPPFTKHTPWSSHRTSRRSFTYCRPE